MKPCTVSVISTTGERHEHECQASSLFDAASQAIEQWARLWWWPPDGIVEVVCEGKRWKVSAGTVALWRRRQSRM